MEMRILISFVLLSVSLSSCIAGSKENRQNGRNLILSDQELRLVGSTLRNVLASNANSYVSGKEIERRLISM